MVVMRKKVTVESHFARLLVQVLPCPHNGHLLHQVGAGDLGLIVGASGRSVTFVPGQGGQCHTRGDGWREGRGTSALGTNPTSTS